MQIDDLEYSISQYLDGNLTGAEKTALEVRLREDPEVQAMLAEYRRLDAALRALPLPVVRWEALSRFISSAVDAAHEEVSARTYRMPFWVRIAAPLALAASLTIVSWLGIRAFLGHSKTDSKSAQIEQPKGPSHVDLAMATSIIVIGPQPEKTAGPVEESVSVGPGIAATDEPTVVHYSDDAVSRPSSVTIASGVVPVHDDTEALQFDMQ